jgi:hypothetical protein
VTVVDRASEFDLDEGHDVASHRDEIKFASSNFEAARQNAVPSQPQR